MKKIARKTLLSTIIFLFVGDVGIFSSLAIETARYLTQLSYERGEELDADKLALELLQERNINPYGFSTLLDKLNTKSDSLPEFLSTHPETKNRKKVFSDMLNTKKKVYSRLLSEKEWKIIKNCCDYASAKPYLLKH